MSDFEKRDIPSNIDAEKYILSSLMLYSDCYDIISEIGLSSEDFFDQRHQIIFKIIRELIDENKPTEVYSVTDKLINLKLLDKAGGAKYVSELLDIAPTSAFASHYANIVKEKSVLRKIINLSREFTAKAFSETQNVKALLDEYEKKILDINQDMYVNTFSDVKEVLTKVVNDIVTKKRGSGEYSGVPSGFFDLDNLTDGFQNSELVIIAGRPSSGKTAFALNIIANTTIRYKKKVGIFSCEMSKEALMLRLLCSEARVDQTLIKKNIISKEAQDKISNVGSILYDTVIIFDDTPNIQLLELRSKARKMKREYDIDILFIDYLQLISYSDNNNNNVPRHEQIAYISRNLKSLARELNIPVVALAQLNRNVESRGEDSQPRLSDLKDSGSIEQDADLIIFIHRKNPSYDAKTEIEKRELILAKNRNGPIDTIELNFLKNYTRFQLATKDDKYE